MSGKDTRLTTVATTTAELVIQLLEPRLKEIQDQIRHLDNKLDVKLDALQHHSVSIAKNNADIKSFLKKEAAGNAGAVEVLEKRLGAMEAKLADLEDRSRCCNVCFVGLKEGAEGTQAAKYLEKSLRDWFPSLNAGKVEVMQAHRIYDGRMTRYKPRTMIFNVLLYHTIQAILQAARKAPPPQQMTSS